MFLYMKISRTMVYIGLLQALIIIAWYTMILTVLKYLSLRISINFPGMAMSRVVGKDTIPKAARKMKRSGFTGCQPRDSFQKGMKSPGS